MLCCGCTLTDFPISTRLTSLALWQSLDCPSAGKATLMNMDKYFMWNHYERLHNHNKAKHNKTVCIFIGIYCSLSTESSSVAMDIFILILSFIVYSEPLVYLCVKIAHFTLYPKKYAHSFDVLCFVVVMQSFIKWIHMAWFDNYDFVPPKAWITTCAFTRHLITALRFEMKYITNHSRDYIKNIPINIYVLYRTCSIWILG